MTGKTTQPCSNDWFATPQKKVAIVSMSKDNRDATVPNSIQTPLHLQPQFIFNSRETKHDSLSSQIQIIKHYSFW